MKRMPVESSSIRAIWYDEKDNILEIEFHHGGIYQYFDVPVEEYMSLIDADSIGGYFNWEIRDDYDYIRVR